MTASLFTNSFKGHNMNQNIRFFVYNDDDSDDPIIEATEQEFLDYDGEIHYERFTVRENGCAQVCLTKYPQGMIE
jgi:hypothetical protein